jgi:hypothetical protein
LEGNVSNDLQILTNDGLTVSKSQLRIDINCAVQTSDRDYLSHFWPFGRARDRSLQIECRSALSQIADQTWTELRLHDQGVRRTLMASDPNDYFRTKSSSLGSIGSGVPSSSSSSSLSDSQLSSPAITLNESAQFSIGSEAAVDCQVAPSRPPAFLQWFVNDRPLGHTFAPYDAAQPISSAVKSERDSTSSVQLGHSSNEYLFSRLLLSRTQPHARKQAEPDGSFGAYPIAADPLTPNLHNASQPNIYTHFASQSTAQTLRLPIRFPIVKRHYQVTTSPAPSPFSLLMPICLSPRPFSLSNESRQAAVDR